MFVNLLLGHLFGDYLLQNNWMALNKKKKFLPLLFHCITYSLVVYFSIMSYFISKGFWINLYVFVTIFGSHIFIDGTYIIEAWMKFIGGRQHDGNIIAPANVSFEDYRAIYHSYTAIVYVVSDNTLHLTWMWVMLNILL